MSALSAIAFLALCLLVAALQIRAACRAYLEMRAVPGSDPMGGNRNQFPEPTGTDRNRGAP